jgi:hypothetical protein
MNFPTKILYAFRVLSVGVTCLARFALIGLYVVHENAYKV